MTRRTLLIEVLRLNPETGEWDVFKVFRVRVKNGTVPDGWLNRIQDPDILALVRDNSNRVSVTIPDGVTIIENRAFAKLLSLVSVKIPKGIKTGQKLRVRGKGEPGHGGRGDLMLKVTVAEHPVYRRRGDDIELDLEVPFSTAALGGAVEIELPSGETKKPKVPPGTPSGRKIRLRGEGFPKRGAARGDLYVRIMVAAPEALSEEQRAAVEALRDLGL